jgi:hypothetical protein
MIALGAYHTVATCSPPEVILYADADEETL